MVISSRRNDLVRYAARLAESHAFRRAQGQFFAEGARLCADAAQSGTPVLKLFYTEQARQRYASYLEEIAPLAKEVYEIEPHVAELLAGTKTSQGIFCVCQMPVPVDVSVLAGRHCLGLETIQDPANLGTVLRTAEALGVGGVLLCGPCCDPYGPKALRAGMGAAFRLPCLTAKSVPGAVAMLAPLGYHSYAAVLSGGAVHVTMADFSAPTFLAVGNEGNGLTDEAVAACGGQVTIPMAGRAESLNAAASAAILMWELVRGGAPHG